MSVSRRREAEHETSAESHDERQRVDARMRSILRGMGIRRTAFTFDVVEGLTRLRRSIPAIVQILLGAAVSYSLAHYVLGHQYPMLAVVIVISSLGLAGNAGAVRVLETGLGMAFGVAFADLIITAFGRGLWQLLMVLTVTLVVTRLFTPRISFTMPATIQACVVVMVPLQPGQGPFDRAIDALVGALIALLLTILLPRDPRGEARRASAALLGLDQRALLTLAEATRDGDPELAVQGLELLRGSQGRLDRWASALESMDNITRFSPLYRRYRDHAAQRKRVFVSADYATRNLRVTSRRLITILGDREPRPELADIFADLMTGFTLIDMALDDSSNWRRATQHLRLIAVRLDPYGPIAHGALADQTIIMMLRPLVVDLLRACGVSRADAVACLPSGSDVRELSEEPAADAPPRSDLDD